MSGQTMLLVNASVLPAVYSRVLEAKQLLSTGGAKTAAQAAQMAGISRGAFYKYKDHVFAYNRQTAGRVVTLNALLQDNPGILSALIGALSEAGANILTLNQNIPAGGTAAVSVSIRTDDLESDVQQMVAGLAALKGVLSIQEVAGQ